MFHPTIEYMFFSAVHGIFSKIDHTLVNKASFSKCKIIEIILCILIDYTTMKLEINDQKKHTEIKQIQRT